MWGSEFHCQYSNCTLAAFEWVPKQRSGPVRGKPCIESDSDSLHTSLKLLRSVGACLVKPFAAGECVQVVRVGAPQICCWHTTFPTVKVQTCKSGDCWSVENNGVAECMTCDSFLWGACEALRDRYLFSGFEAYMWMLKRQKKEIFPPRKEATVSLLSLCCPCVRFLVFIFFVIAGFLDFTKNINNGKKMLFVYLVENFMHLGLNSSSCATPFALP